MRKKLIVNADGFGFGKGATRAILEAIEKGGPITSVSVNANFPEAAMVTDLARNYPGISIGVHLNPMVGTPCLPAEEVPTLVDGDGCFHANRFPLLLRDRLIDMKELEAELDAQIARMKGLAGDRISHLDSQANRHLMYLGLFLKLAKKWKIERMRNNAPAICLECEDPAGSRLRAYMSQPHIWLGHVYRKYQMGKASKNGMRMAQRLVTVGYGKNGNKTNPDNWRRIFKNLPEGVSEIYCHPAYPDETLRKWASYCEERVLEMGIISDGSLAKMADGFGIKLISFYDI